MLGKGNEFEMVTPGIPQGPQKQGCGLEYGSPNIRGGRGSVYVPKLEVK